MSLILGAYPMLFHAPQNEERELYDVLAADPRVGGLELPWVGALHPEGEQWLLAAIPEHWTIVLTAIPSTMGALANDPHHGLASRDVAGRARAVTQAALMADAVRSINDRAGRAVVTAVELHSAPRAAEGSPEALRASLEDLVIKDWDGARLLLEHCDAASADHEPAKGFLALEQELHALSGLPVGVLLNWARSAIELRDADRVVEHVTLAREAGALEGLFFSGVADVDSLHGGAWGDSHLPFAPHVPESLLTPARVAVALEAAGPVPFTGIKLSWTGEQSTAARAAALLDGVDRVSPTPAVSR